MDTEGPKDSKETKGHRFFFFFFVKEGSLALIYIMCCMWATVTRQMARHIENQTSKQRQILLTDRWRGTIITDVLGLGSVFSTLFSGCIMFLGNIGSNIVNITFRG